jgi:hypothetical protein
MKYTIPKLPLAGTLLVSYAVYSAFVPVSIAHSIIVFSLTLFAGFDHYLQSHQLPSTNTKIEDLRKEMSSKLEQQKADYEVKLQKVEEEMSRQAIARANSSSVSSQPKKAPIAF